VLRPAPPEVAAVVDALGPQRQAPHAGLGAHPRPHGDLAGEVARQLSHDPQRVARHPGRDAGRQRVRDRGAEREGDIAQARAQGVGEQPRSLGDGLGGVLHAPRAARGAREGREHLGVAVVSEAEGVEAQVGGGAAHLVGEPRGVEGAHGGRGVAEVEDGAVASCVEGGLGVEDHASQVARAARSGVGDGVEDGLAPRGGDALHASRGAFGGASAEVAEEEGHAVVGARLVEHGVDGGAGDFERAGRGGRGGVEHEREVGALGLGAAGEVQVDEEVVVPVGAAAGAEVAAGGGRDGGGVVDEVDDEVAAGAPVAAAHLHAALDEAGAVGQANAASACAGEVHVEGKLADAGGVVGVAEGQHVRAVGAVAGEPRGVPEGDAHVLAGGEVPEARDELVGFVRAEQGDRAAARGVAAGDHGRSALDGAVPALDGEAAHEGALRHAQPVLDGYGAVRAVEEALLDHGLGEVAAHHHLDAQLVEAERARGLAGVGAGPQARRAAYVAGSHALRRRRAAGPVVPDARGAHGEGARTLQRLALRELPLPRTLPIRHLPAHGDDACARGASRHVALHLQGRVADAHARVGAHIDRALLVAPARDKHPPALHAGPTVGEAHPRVAREAQREAEVGVHERAPVGGGLDGGGDVDPPVAHEGGSAHAHARVEHLHRRAGGGAGGEGLGARPAGERGDGERAEEQSQGGVHRATSVAAVSARGERVVPAASKRNTLWSGSKRSR
jgi:hypothetical protein